MTLLDKLPIMCGGGILYVAGMGLLMAALRLPYPTELQAIFAAAGMLHGWFVLRTTP